MADFEAVTNQIIVLGGGLAPSIEDPGTLTLSHASLERANRMLEYYRAHATAFLGESAMIVCSGGASAIYDGIDINDLSRQQTEGSLLADHLLHNGVSAQLIETETQSDTTTTNIINSIELGLLDPKSFSVNNPLGVVTHKNHYLRAVLDLRDAGFAPGSSVSIHPDLSDNAHKERALRLVRAAFFAGVRPGDLSAMRERNTRLTRAFGRTK